MSRSSWKVRGGPADRSRAASKQRTSGRFERGDAAKLSEPGESSGVLQSVGENMLGPNGSGIAGHFQRCLEALSRWRPLT